MQKTHNPYPTPGPRTESGQPTEILTIPQVMDVLSLSRATLNRMRKAGTLMPVVIAKNSQRYLWRDIEAYINSCKKAGTIKES